jgi:hypothetical protein
MLSKTLIVTLETKYYQSAIPTRKISYSGSSIDLTDEEYENVFQSIPSFWNNENDKLIRFIFFEDKSYFCEREKKIFNYTTRDTDTKIYKFDYASNEEAEKLYVFFIEKYAKLKIERIENLYDSIISQIKDFSFIKSSIFNARNNLLEQSDYIMMPDYPISEEEREKWATYRQELRDITQQEAWIANDVINIKMPVSPIPTSQLNVLKTSVPDLSGIPTDLIDDVVNNIEDGSIENLIKNMSEISIKFELLRNISKMKIPILSFDESEIIAHEQDYENFLNEVKYDTLKESILPSNWWEAATTNIEQKIAEVNTTLKKYNIDFTIGDILDSIIEENKFSEQDIEVNTIIEEL